jgi:hypothetical protein
MRASAFAAAALAGCASAVYVEPSGPTSASLRFENQGPPIFGYELTAQTYTDPAACNGKLLIASGLKRGVTHTVRVPADTQFTFSLKAAGGGASRGDACVLAGSFVPRAGVRYVAVFRAEERKCDVLFVRQDVTPAGARRNVDEPSYRARREPACL